MSLQNVQAQLGNILAAMPLKLQKVQSSFLDSVNPPFEGAIASDSDGQFYIIWENFRRPKFFCFCSVRISVFRGNNLRFFC